MAKKTLADLEEILKTRSLTVSERQARKALLNPDGYAAIARRYYAKNAEKIRQHARDYYKANREKRLEAAKIYTLENADKRKAWREQKLIEDPEYDRRKAREWRAKNLEKAKEMGRKSAIRNRENRLKQTAAWREANPEHVKAYQVAYDKKRSEEKSADQRAKYAANPEAARKARRDWCKANPEQAARNARAGKARRRARKLEAGGSHTQAETDALFFTQGARCANPYCCVEIDIRTAHLDHIYPLAPRAGGKQGSNVIANLEWLCQPCNQRKTNLDPAEWARREAKRAGLF